jgi:hypothetical protein
MIQGINSVKILGSDTRTSTVFTLCTAVQGQKDVNIMDSDTGS